MAKWYMLTVVGRDKRGIVAQITQALYQNGCNLGEASMMRLGGNFTMMLMAQHDGDGDSLQQVVEPVAAALTLHIHVDEIEASLHRHRSADVRVTVFGADRAGIVAQVTTTLADAGMDILDLESDVAGSADKPLYIMHIEGCATAGIDALETALSAVNNGIEVRLAPVETLIG